MLALKSKLTMTLLIAATFMIMSDTGLGQQTPAQRYQPVREGSFGSAPPSVHIPPEQMQRLAPRFQTKANGPVAPNGLNPRNPGTSYSFSDANRSKPTPNLSQSGGQSKNPQRPGFEQFQSSTAANSRQIQQASYEDARAQEPAVPAILAGQPKPTQTATTKHPESNGFQASNTSLAPANIDTTKNAETPTKTPADFENQMRQARSGLPRIAPGELASQQQDISAQMAEVRRRVEEKSKQQAALAIQIEAEKAAANQTDTDHEETVPQGNQLEGNPLQGPLPQAIVSQESNPQQTANNAADEATDGSTFDVAAAHQDDSPADASVAEATQAVSATDFIGQIAESNESTTEPAAPVQDPNTAPKLVAKQGSDVQPQPAVMQLTSAQETLRNEMLRDAQVRTVSSETDDATASIKLAAPAIEVETFGPQSIGINKPANYQVVVHNHSSTKAERILVGINLPAWINIENVNMTSGGKELTDGKNQARLVWSIDQIPGNASQTITITAVPTKAELFDVGVEWTFVPRTGKAAVTVTEPKLEMNISGPMEVLYGETALYHVTVRNPGTGEAENVIVMLPEALGGERATLGNIEAGKEKNFQVELLARTAGDLNLIATAAGDGNLKTSAERALTVRRAILGISLEGPGLKYAGSVAQYVVNISNTGDATAAEVVTAVALPPGVKYLGGIEAVKLIEGGMRWPVGSLEPGQTRKYLINCQLDTSGDLQLEVGARGKGDLAASSACLTTVETVADLVLMVADPKGPLPTGEEIPYEIKVQNRGSKSAKGVNLVMQFSEGIEPKMASGIEHRIVPGQVLFSPIEEIEPGQEVSFKVTASAMKSGTHIFRAQLTCEDSDAREIAEGTTRFFGENVQPTATANATTESNDFRADSETEFKR